MDRGLQSLPAELSLDSGRGAADLDAWRIPGVRAMLCLTPGILKAVQVRTCADFLSCSVELVVQVSLSSLGNKKATDQLRLLLQDLVHF